MLQIMYIYPYRVHMYILVEIQPLHIIISYCFYLIWVFSIIEASVSPLQRQYSFSAVIYLQYTCIEVYTAVWKACTMLEPSTEPVQPDNEKGSNQRFSYARKLLLQSIIKRIYSVFNPRPQNPSNLADLTVGNGRFLPNLLKIGPISLNRLDSDGRTVPNRFLAQKNGGVQIFRSIEHVLVEGCTG